MSPINHQLNSKTHVFLKANLAVQEAKLNIAMEDLRAAEATLSAKEAELQEVQSMYEKAVKEKQVSYHC